MNDLNRWLLVPAILLPAAASAPAFAVQYLSIEQARGVLFPSANQFDSRSITLTEPMRSSIEAQSGMRVRNTTIKAWQARLNDKSLGWVILDEVYGKHEFITYAIAIGNDGTVKGVEILDYRETHGSEVQNPKWRAQFTGKKASDPLKLDEDIKNISGATLSCRHITDGIKRLLVTWEVALK